MISCIPTRQLMALKEKRTFGSAGGDSNTIGLQEIVLIFSFFFFYCAEESILKQSPENRQRN